MVMLIKGVFELFGAWNKGSTQRVTVKLRSEQDVEVATNHIQVMLGREGHLTFWPSRGFYVVVVTKPPKNQKPLIPME